MRKDQIEPFIQRNEEHLLQVLAANGVTMLGDALLEYLDAKDAKPYKPDAKPKVTVD
jgi:hypothetical protein